MRMNAVCRLALLVSWAASSSTPSAPQIQGPWVEGHRGSRATHPENTLVAFEHALRAGVDVLELDTAILKDGTVVVSHDSHVSPGICSATRSVRPGETLFMNLSWNEVKTLDCGSNPNPRFPNQQRIPANPPRLDEVFLLTKAMGADHVRFNIETKVHPANANWTVDPTIFAKQVVKSIENNGMISRSVLQSFDERSLIVAKQIRPELQLSFLTASRFVEGCRKAQSLGAAILSPYWPLVTKKMTHHCHRLGIQVVPWTANAPEEWDYLIKSGVDGLITDDPEALIDHLVQRGIRSGLSQESQR
jgi:glycerophosphoryl diester phosphodiesterase